MGTFKKWKHGLYTLIALAMVLTALPRISLTGGLNWVNGFGIVWVLFALLVIGANLHFLLGVDEEKRKTLERVRRAKMKQWQMKWEKEADKGSTL
ncbi:hypothetical protein NST83_08370 [Paenibacillus sp. FSL R10-2782]|uniref:Uncharacterized protein n=1 Tax=Paenibacillus terrae TaxID=159743 RepID=A0A4U2PT20_9BACL|nr:MULTISPECIES: hypothetical protein [Paenibacillus]MBE0337958.1 hypothetical protein [Paenibacillus sp. 23TSA30-6]TKH42812.1 hypothetical protein C1I60_14805 [Paenibacillus terrae]